MNKNTIKMTKIKLKNGHVKIKAHSKCNFKFYRVLFVSLLKIKQSDSRTNDSYELILLKNRSERLLNLSDHLLTLRSLSLHTNTRRNNS